MKLSLALLLILSSTAFVISQRAADPVTRPTPVPVDTKIGKKVKRWFDLDGALLQTRYRFIDIESRNLPNVSQGQWQANLRGHFQFDQKARYRLNWLVETGNNFTSGWNNLGWGTGPPQTNLYVKQLYFDARPTKKFEFQMGGIEFNRGEATEAITYDNDGYLTGERVTVRAPKQLFFDEISATNAYLGDLLHPSVFSRFKHLAKSDYHQVLVRKQATKAIGFSVDYTFDSGRDRLHEAVRIKAPKRLYLNTLVVESYQRLDPQRDAGFDIYGERVVNKRLTMNGGFAKVDRRLTLNGDRFQPGNRLYMGSVIKLGHSFSLNPVVIHAVGDLPPGSTQRTRFDLILSYNLLEDLRRHHIL